MKQAHASLTTPRSAEEVYAYLVDFDRHVEWRFDVLASELISGRTGEVGARYRQRVKTGRREATSEVELTRAEPGRAVGFETVDDGAVTVSGTYAIERRGDVTHIANEVVLEPHGFVKLFEPFMGPAIRKTARRYETGLAERLGGSPGG